MTIPEFKRHKQNKKKLIVVTAYDALFTRIVEQAGIETILVGDSLGVVVQGKANTLSVTMDDMLSFNDAQAGHVGPWAIARPQPLHHRLGEAAQPLRI